MKSFLDLNHILQFLISEPNEIKRNILNVALKRIIPFNQPHGFSIIDLKANSSKIKIPYKKANFNHVKGIHATCLATGGEYAAGLLLMQNFLPKEYRIILSNLSVDYKYQAKKTCFCYSQLASHQIEQNKEKLKNTSAVNIELITTIKDLSENEVCEVKTNWQVKKWNQVKTKL